MVVLLVGLLVAENTKSADLIKYRKSRPFGFNALEYEKKSYYLSLLIKALEITKEEYGSYSLKASHVYMLPKRASLSLSRGKLIDVFWDKGIPPLTKQLLAINVPLLRGYGGYQIFLIRKEDKEKFQRIKSIAQLKALTAGQVAGTGNSKLLTSNGFTVKEITRHKALFNMLKYKRFDYFPMKVYGVYLHLKEHPELIVEESIALFHPQSIYYYVNKNNQKLHDRIYLGLRKLEENGQFEKHFQTHKMMRPYQHFNANNLRKLFIIQAHTSK